jgi:uncharacterized protein (DUF3820 family)
MTIKFGKYYGRQLKDVPRDYLAWMIREDIQPRYHTAIRKVLAVPVKEENLTEYMEKQSLKMPKIEGWKAYKARKAKERAEEERTAHVEYLGLISERLGHPVVD